MVVRAPEVPVYATTARPDVAQQLGFHGAKFPLPYGPEAGAEGMRKNVECCQAPRPALCGQNGRREKPVPKVLFQSLTGSEMLV